MFPGDSAIKNLLKTYKLFLTIIIGALIGGETICFSGEGNTNGTTEHKDAPNVAATADKCSNIPALPDGSIKLVTKVIDGDTVVIEGGTHVRLLGIDADERDHPCYEPAKDRLEELILNKEIKLEKKTEDKDQWCRYLRYVFLDNQNIGLTLVKEGMAVARFSPEDVKYRKEIVQAEKEARKGKIGCKWNGNATKEKKKTKFSWEQLTTEKTGLKVVGACQTSNYYEKEMVVEGKIASAFRSNTNTIFLNFEKSYPDQCFTAVIFSADQSQFIEGPEKYYSQKTVRVKGEIQKYNRRPEIILGNPAQIEVGK
ncbi:MAG: thermonuclease family protein [Elusimicrobia bacterium]|nr:thermonuclease family protein [Elusimicrobiota bacterium]